MRTHTVGSVSYLNALPLVEGLDEEPGVTVTSDVPSRLLDILLEGRASVALCPIIDYQTSSTPLVVVPVGAIGSASTTLTVRVFSRRPLPDVDHIAVDGDSSTSVALLQVVLHELYTTRPKLTTFNHRPTLAEAADGADAILLIGDKVIASAPKEGDFPHQLDLGDAWRRIFGLPFVFAAWMTRRGTDLEELPGVLRQRREVNRGRIRDIIERHATKRGWTRELAELYLCTLLRFDLGQRELKAMSVFWQRCRELGLIDEVRPLELYDVSD
jgi:chorismate dehydratase